MDHRRIDHFLDEIRVRLEPELIRLRSGEPIQWVAIADQQGTVLTTLEPVLAVHEMLGGLIASGVEAAAYLRYLSEPESLLAYVYVRDPSDSDVRRGMIRHTKENGISLGRWEQTVV